MPSRALFICIALITAATTVVAAAAFAVPTWCVADRDKACTMISAMKNGQHWACEEGGADCSPIQPPTGLCFHPNRTLFHASFAYNAYYHNHAGAPGSCYFNGTAVLTANDPSYGSCVYPPTYI